MSIKAQFNSEVYEELLNTHTMQKVDFLCEK